MPTRRPVESTTKRRPSPTNTDRSGRPRPVATYNSPVVSRTVSTSIRASEYRPSGQPMTSKTGKPRIVVGISTESEGQPIAEMSSALAEKLGVTPIAFPGDHVTGFDQHAAEFAEALHRAFAEQ